MRMILIILLTTLAWPAWADAGSVGNLHLFTPPPGDISVDFLRQIFGNSDDGLGIGGGNTVIAAAMGVFNQAVLFLAMIFVLFTTIKGTVDSAHDGVILGKKMSEVWVPIRTVLGTAFLLPLASGFSLIQMAVLWLILQGVGVADQTWSAAMGRFAQTGALANVSIPDARPLAASILRSEVCMAIMNKQFTDTSQTRRIEAVTTPARVQLVNAYYATVDYRWQSTAQVPGSPAVCGAIEWKEAAQTELTEGSTHVARGAIWMAHQNAVNVMIAELRPAAAQIAAFGRPAPGVVDLAAKRYSDSIAAAARLAIVQSPDAAQLSFLEHAANGGWVLTGTWFSHMIKLQDAIQASTNMLPVSKPARIENLEVDEALISYRDAMVFTNEYLLDRSAAPADSYQSELENSSSIRSMDDLTRLVSIPAMSAMQSITEQIAGGNISPLTQLSATGHTIINAGWLLKGAIFTIAGFAGSKLSSWTAGLVFDVSAALGTILGTLEFASSSLWALGAVLAFYLPAVPAIWWLVGVIRWLASCAEAVLSAPLMAAMMTSSEGDDLVGRAGPGMYLILACIIQPVLLVLGFIIAAAMTYPAGQLVNMMFLGIVSGASEGSVVGLIGLIAYCCLYVGMMVVAMHSCFALISAVPQNVMAFVGSQAGGQGIGQAQGDKGISGLEAGAAGAGAAAARKSPGGGDKPGGKAGGEPKGGNGFTNADHMPGN